MSRCPTFTLQVSIMSKWLAKHISTKVPFKITIRKIHVYIEIRWPWDETIVSIWEFEMIFVLNVSFSTISFATRLNSQNKNESAFINELWHINLFMNIGISNWHKEVSTSSKCFFFTLFQFRTRLLTSKHRKIFST